MKIDQMSDMAHAEANALGAQVAALKDRLVQNPVVSMIAGSSMLWFLLGKRKAAPSPHPLETQQWEDEGGAVVPPAALPEFVPETTLLQAIGPGIGAMALGVVAATLIPRTKSEDKVMGATGDVMRDHAGLMGDAAVALLGVVARQAGAEILGQWERSFSEMLEGLAGTDERPREGDTRNT